MTTNSGSRFLSSIWIGMFVLTVAFAPQVLAQKELSGPLQFKVNIVQLHGLNLEIVDGIEWVTTVDLASGTTRTAAKTTYPTITLHHAADGNNKVWMWYKNAAMMGQIDNRPGTIDLVDANGNPARSYALPLLVPTRYRLVNTDNGVVEELEVAVLNPTGETK